jgi:hypothetical protein
MNIADSQGEVRAKGKRSPLASRRSELLVEKEATPLTSVPGVSGDFGVSGVLSSQFGVFLGWA